MHFGFHDWIGTVGVALVVGSYLALQLGRLASASLAYSLFNAVGAAFIAISLLYEFNLSAFLIEVFWVLISLLGIARWRAARRR